MAERLKTEYNDLIIPKLMQTLNLKNHHQVPKVSKIVVNQGIGEASYNSKVLNVSLKELSLITGQRGRITKSKKAIAAFKLRPKLPVGMFITLRGNSMYAFLDRLICLALPRIRDFQGINPKSFDGSGNFSLGLQEQLVFPEIAYDQIEKIRGMDVSIITTAKNDQDGYLLLKEFGMPFRDHE